MNTKPSSTLRFLESHEVFTLAEYMTAVDPSVTERTRYLNLQNAVERGQAYRAKRGLYASNIGVYRDRVPDVFLVAAKAAEDAVLTHHTALEAHGVAHSPFRTVYYTSARKLRDFDVRGYRFTRVAPPALSDRAATLDGFVTRVRAGDVVVPVSTKERTLVDCLRELRLAGGLEELLRSVGGFTSLSAEKVSEYARLLGSPTLLARAGWVLDMERETWQVDPLELERMRAALGRGTYRLAGSRAGESQEFVARWRLYVPAGLPYEEWIRG
jgi:predicted transcriptional regulator of viral defense system